MQINHRTFIWSVVAALALHTAAYAGTITVMWDPVPSTKVAGYRIYVGTAPGRQTEMFDVEADASFFIYRSAFNGVRYYFSVATRWEDGKYSPRSTEVTSVGTRVVAGGVKLDDALTGCGADCFVVSPIASGLGDIGAVAAAADGSVFAIENGSRVLLFRGGAAVSVLTAETGTRLVDLALDTHFSTTGRVFVSQERARDAATSDGEIVRYRLVGSALGEPAAVVAGLSMPVSAALPIAVGDDGRLFVAVPESRVRDPYSASLLAFDQDGRVPADQRGGSPVIAPGVAVPADLGWDAQSKRVWLAGRSADGTSSVISASVAGDVAAIGAPTGEGEDVTAVGVAAAGVRRLLLAAGVDVIEVAPGTSDAVRVALDEYGVPGAIAPRAEGGYYVAVRQDRPTGAVSSIVAVTGSPAGVAP